MLLIGAVFGSTSTLAWRVGPSARTVTGTVSDIDPAASAIVLRDAEGPGDVAGLADVGLGIVGVLWSDGAGEWRRGLSPQGHPTCLSPEDVGRVVDVGLVTDPGGLGRPSSEVIAWLRCAGRSD